jgi:glycosyltransferase involved in cell wall biosynthesis
MASTGEHSVGECVGGGIVTGIAGLVSILIPAFNAERWVARAIQSALDQTWRQKEVIVVNDGSTDVTGMIAREFESAGVRVFDQTNRGASAARNRAFHESQGAYVQYLDADDLLDPAKIEVQMRRLATEEPAFLAAGAWARFHADPSTARFVPEPVWVDLQPVEWLVSSWMGGGMMHPAAWLVPRGVVERAGPWNEALTLNDDGEFFCRTLLASRGVKFCHEARTYYRSGLHGSLSSIRCREAHRSSWQATETSIAHLLARENSERTRRAAADALQRLAFQLYPDAPDLVRLAEDRMRELGGSGLSYDGSRVTRWLSRAVGWKAMRRLQHFRRAS